MAKRAYNKQKMREALHMRTPSGSAVGWITVDLRGEPRVRGQHKRLTRVRKTETVKQLVAVVADEAEQCERLLGLMRHQQAFMISGDTSGIEANARELETALHRLSDFQRQRQQLIAILAKGAGFDGGKPDFARIIDTVSIDYGRRLSELHTSIKKTIERLCETKEQNRMLIERSLGNINEFICRTKLEGSSGSFEPNEPLGGPRPS